MAWSRGQVDKAEDSQWRFHEIESLLAPFTRGSLIEAGYYIER